METGLTNLGSGGEAKASPADRADTYETGPETDAGADAAGLGGSGDATMAPNLDPALLTGTGDAGSPGGSAGSVTLSNSVIGTTSPQLGHGQTAAYGETVENEPFPTLAGAGGEDNDQQDDLDDNDDDEDDES